MDSLLHRNVLDSMSEGVLTVTTGGRIGILNPAASRLLGLESAEVRGKTIADVLMNREDLEAFNDIVLAAVYDEAVGTRSTIGLRLRDGTERSVDVTTSYLVIRKDSEARRVGLVAVLDDVTEVETLREAERELAEATQEQNTKLRDAYREIEEKNRTLDSALKKVSTVRGIAMVLVAVLFVGAAWYVWDETGTALVDEIAGTSGKPAGADAVVTATVAPRPLTTTLTFVGSLSPRSEIRVTSPVAGKVARMLFEYGDRVSAGQRLMELDTAETTRRYRSAQAEYLEARDRLSELENWASSPEMVRGRRTVARASLELETRKSKLAETALLLDKGIIPASEHEAARRQYDAQQLSHQAALQDMETLLARVDADALQVARLKLENAETRMQELENTLRSAVIRAPVSGIVLHPGGGGSRGKGQGNDGEPPAPGNSVSEGDYLLTVADLEGLSVAGEVDEVDVVKLRPGQPARISGDAFPELELKGEISRISSLSQPRGRRNVPSFEVTAAVDRLSDRQRQGLRLGMSAKVVVVIRDEPAALLVPLAAVQGKQGNYRVRVRGEDGTMQRVPVEIGSTTLNEVEIVSGLKAGDEVIVSGH